MVVLSHYLKWVADHTLIFSAHMRKKQNILTNKQPTSSECSPDNIELDEEREQNCRLCWMRGNCSKRNHKCVHAYICDPFHFKRWCIFIQEGAAGSCADRLLKKMQLISFFSLISALRPVIWECHFIHHSIVKISNYAEAVKSFLGNFFFFLFFPSFIFYTSLFPLKWTCYRCSSCCGKTADY